MITKDLTMDFFLCKTEHIAVTSWLRLRLIENVNRNKERPTHDLVDRITDLNNIIDYQQRTLTYLIQSEEERRKLIKEVGKLGLEVQKLTKERDDLKKIANNIHESI